MEADVTPNPFEALSPLPEGIPLVAVVLPNAEFEGFNELDRAAPVEGSLGV